MPDKITETAFAIYSAWSREPDPHRARQRFERLQPTIRQQFENEARAAIAVVEAFNHGAYA